MLAFFSVVTLVMWAFQAPITYGRGAPWDAAGYVFMAKRFAAGEDVAGTAPFVYRIGTPYVASFLDVARPVTAFRIVNLAANAASTMLLLFWLARFVASPVIRVLLCFLSVIHWNGFTRFVFYISPITDPWAGVFVLAGLIVLSELSFERGTARAWRWIAALSAIVFVGTLFREYVALLGVAALFARNPLRRCEGKRIRWRDAFPFTPVLAAAVAGLAVSQTLVVATNDYSFVATAWAFVIDKALAIYLLAWFQMFSPWLFVALYDWREGARFLGEHQPLLVFLAGIAVLAWVGGGHTERFVSWAGPVAYVLVGRAVERHAAALASPPMAAILAAVSLLTARAFWTTPDFPDRTGGWTAILFTTVGPGTRLFDLLSFEQDHVRVFWTVVQHLTVGGLVAAWLRMKRRQAPARVASGQAASGNTA